jgi:hypothetical protein
MGHETRYRKFSVFISSGAELMQSSLFVNLKAENSWNVPLGWLLGFEMAICHQEEMRECCSEVCSVNI